jgi:hypothetical protein
MESFTSSGEEGVCRRRKRGLSDHRGGRRDGRHGPFVMTTQEEIQETLKEYQQGVFLKKRAPWNFKKVSFLCFDFKIEFTLV